jgi:hypothetical protein
MRKFLILLFVSSPWFCCSGAAAPLAIHLHSTLPSPQPVGTTIGFSPRIENSSKGMHVFRYSVSVNSGPFHVVRDFSQNRDFAWTPELYEHAAAIRVTARNNETKETADDTARFEIASRIKGKTAVVTYTAHPLVALFSAPPCAEGSQFRIAFQVEGEEPVTRTPAQPCRESISNNVWVAGMRANSEYRMRSELVHGKEIKQGAWLPFHSGMVDGEFAPATVVVPRAGGSSVSSPVLIHSAVSLGSSRRPFATGNIIRETNVSRVAEQLESRGIHSDCRPGGKECVSGFHHEAIRLPNGHTMAIAGLERMMPAGTQGSKEPVDILGDLVVDLDEDFQVAGVWNTFDHLDINRKSYQDAKCKTGGGGCPPVLLAPEANGWTHSNSLNYIPSSGDFLVSIPEQDWVLKVDWKNGKGSGKILWRLGKGGDFKPDAKDPNPWFSYVHDVGFEPLGSNLLTVLDDSDFNHGKDASVESRAQVWKLDEEKLTAILAYNVNLGGFSICCGSMQVLKNGGYSSVVGWIDMESPHGRTVETDKNGKIVYAIELEGVLVYRSYRLDDMYSAPVK